MAEFEIFSLVLSLILGLGVAQILSSAVHLIHSRRKISTSWTPVLWAFAIFLFHLNFLFATLWFYESGRAFGWYLHDILGAVLLFISGGLILPSESQPLTDDLGTFFESDGRLALIPLGLFIGLSIPWNLEGGVSLLDPNNVILACLLVMSLTAFLSRGRARTAATVISVGLTTYAFLFLWARPGATGG